ncbi:MAG TPA: hotdog fold thioesterase [Saprospiraceae bacterium]|nr:hotdog fold thioesterase [Saprospiraceae bacterium]HMQ83342.1 hotdog fold thioesterase [Saprospiraceae bacterium]
MIWKQAFTLEGLRQMGQNTLLETLGMELVEIGDDFIVMKMPVDHRTVQPMRLLHGGASVALAESLGSIASTLCLDDLQTQTVVGVEINANHLRSVKEGYVFGKATPLRIGRKIHVWNIEIKDEANRLICVSRLTIAVVSIR